MAYARKEIGIEGGWRVIDNYGDYFVVATEAMADHAVKMMNNAFVRGEQAKSQEVRAVLGIE